jgi:hypothetical protein
MLPKKPKFKKIILKQKKFKKIILKQKKLKIVLKQKKPEKGLSALEKITPKQWAWLAGLYQGEAYFTADRRVRAKSPSEIYTPAPPTPIVKLEMVEEDLMNYVGEMVDQNVVLIKRKTTANNSVYRVTLSAREKTEIFLKNIAPYVIGKKRNNEIKILLDICEEYHAWVAAEGRRKAAQIANKASQKATKKHKDKEHKENK